MPHPASSREPSGAAESRPTVDRLDVAAYVVPTDRPESDGTAEWDHTTLVLAQAHAGGATGLGYTYADLSAAGVIQGTLLPVVRGRPVMDVGGTWLAMQRLMRNAGRPGIASTAIAAVDSALWDLKARLLDVPLVDLLGSVHEAVDVYGSGGFTSYSVGELEAQLAGWVEAGITRVKMKVGRDARADVARVRAARAAIGTAAELFVDANGAWTPGRAIGMAARFAEQDVTWFEEPVTSDDLHGLRQVRTRAPRGMEIAAGEYAYDAGYVRRMLEGRAVDVLQADVTRCGGISGWLQIAALCDAFAVPLSAHTAPALHVAPACAVPRLRHVEYFHDHVRIEALFFDGVPACTGGRLRPDRSRPGNGLTLKTADAARFQAR